MSLSRKTMMGADSSNENTALLHSRADPGVGSNGSYGTGLKKSATLNLVMATCGAGILSFPAAFKNGGILITLVLMAIVAVVSQITLSLLVDAAQRCVGRGKLTYSACCYEQVVLKTLGHRIYMVTITLMCFNTLGALTGFGVVIGDISVPVLEKWIGNDSFLSTRTFVALFFGFVLMLPLSMAKTLDGLWISSAIGVLSAAMVTFAISYRGIEAAVHLEASAANVEWIAQPSWSVFLAIPILIFSLGSHLQIIPVYSELSPANRPQTISHVVNSTLAICCLLYAAAGIFGYSHFGEDVKGDILENYKLTDTLMDATKIVMALHVALAFPVCMYPARRCLGRLFAGDAEGDLEWKQKLLQNTCIITVTGTVSILIPQISIVFGFIGGTSSVALDFLFPSWMLLFGSKEDVQQGLKGATPREKYVAYGVIIFGVLTFVISTGTLIAGL